jgi:hypothetical protein
MGILNFANKNGAVGKTDGRNLLAHYYQYILTPLNN